MAYIQCKMCKRARLNPYDLQGRSGYADRSQNLGRLKRKSTGYTDRHEASAFAKHHAAECEERTCLRESDWECELEQR